MKKQLKLMILLTLLSGSAYANKNSEISTVGKAAASLLESTLKGKMKKELVKNDKIHMVSFCATQSIEITKGVNNLLPPGVTVSRTSLKPRSKLNIPTKLEMKQLNYFQNLFEKQNHLKNKYKLVNNKDSYSYFKPVMINKMCLNCHGKKESLNPDVLKKLEELYPNNKAYGYKNGDFRGLIHVKINKKVYK